MAKHANPTIVGGFVVGAAMLVLAAVLVFGRGGWYRNEFTYVAYFEDSVHGLDVGAPVLYKGVQIGRVTKIESAWNLATEELQIPVELTFIEGDDDLPEYRAAYPTSEDFVNHLIEERGLKGVLQLESVITGKLYVSMEFLPDETIVRHGHPELPELPTSLGELGRLRRNLVELPIEELFNRSLAAITAIEELASDPQLRKLLENMDRLIANVDSQVAPLSDSALGTLDEARTLLRDTNAKLDRLVTDVDQLVVEVNTNLGPLSESAQITLEEARTLLANANAELDVLSASVVGATDEGHELLSHLNLGIDEENLLFRVTTLLAELEGAARAVRQLADQLERHPEAILSGKDD